MRESGSGERGKLKKQRGNVLIGETSGMAIPSRRAPGGNETSETVDRYIAFDAAVLLF